VIPVIANIVPFSLRSILRVIHFYDACVVDQYIEFRILLHLSLHSGVACGS